MKKKLFLLLNAVLFIITLALCVRYDRVGGLRLKGLTASGFVVLGAVNLLYAIISRAKNRLFPLLMVLGLVLCMGGDIALNISFFPGVTLFTLGHILYLAAFCALKKPRWQDLIPCAVMFLISVLILRLTPSLNFGVALMEAIVYAYALIISCMVGKTVANYVQQRNLTQLLLMIGSILFYFSDVMLLLWLFGRGGQTADTLCLYTYFPGQCIMAHAMYHFTNTEA